MFTVVDFSLEGMQAMVTSPANHHAIWARAALVVVLGALITAMLACGEPDEDLVATAIRQTQRAENRQATERAEAIESLNAEATAILREIQAEIDEDSYRMTEAAEAEHSWQATEWADYKLHNP